MTGFRVNSTNSNLTNAVTVSSGTAVQVPDGSITTDKFADGSVTTEKLAVGSVTSQTIATQTIQQQNLSQELQETLNISSSGALGGTNKYKVQTFGYQQPAVTEPSFFSKGFSQWNVVYTGPEDVETGKGVLSFSDFVSPMGLLSSYSEFGSQLTSFGVRGWRRTASLLSSSNMTVIAVSSSGQYQTAVSYGSQGSSGLSQGYIYGSSDYGRSWLQNPFESGESFTCVSMSASGKYQITAGDKTSKIYTSKDFGQTWEAHESVAFSIATACAMSSDGQYQVIVSSPYPGSITGGYCIVSGDYGTTFFVPDNGDPMQPLSVEGSIIGCAVSASGDFSILLNRSTSGLSPSIENGAYMSRVMFGSTPIKTSLDDNIEYTSVSMCGSGQYIIVTTNDLDGSFYSQDFGQTWRQDDTCTGLLFTSSCMTFSGQYQAIMTKDGKIYTSIDYGHHWMLVKESEGVEYTGIDVSSSGQYLVAITKDGSIDMCINEILMDTEINPVNYGYQSGVSNQSLNATALGVFSGYNGQSDSAVAIGYQAGFERQGKDAVAIGHQAAYTEQSEGSISIGFGAGIEGQGKKAIAIGYEAGKNGQGDNAIAIGFQAFFQTEFFETEQQPSNSILLNFRGEPSTLTWDPEDTTRSPIGLVIDSVRWINNNPNNRQGLPFTLYLSTILGFASDESDEIVTGYIGQETLLPRLQTELNLPYGEAVDELGVYMIQQIGYEQPWPTLGSTLDNLYKFDGLPWSILYIPNDPKWKADGNSSLGQGQLISTTNVSSLMTLDAFVCFGMSLSHVGESWSTKYETRPWVDIAMSMSGQYQTAVTSLPDGSIYISSDYGNTWTTVYRDVPRSWIGIAMTATGIRQYACSADGLTLESFDFGQSWYKVKIGGQFIYNQVTYDPLDYELSSVCTSNNGFTIYTAIKNLRGPPGVIPTFVIRNFADIYAIYYVTNPGILYPIEPETEVMNAAVTYAATASGGSFVLLSYIGDNNNDGSGIYRTLNDFYTKPKKTSAPSLIYNCIAMSSSGQYVMATSKEDLMNIHLSDDYAKTWSTFPIANAHKCSISFTGQYQVVIQKPGYVYVSTDFGWTWSPRHTSAVRNWSSVTISATGQYITATESEGHIHVCTNDISNINNLQGVQGVQGAIGMNGSTGSGTVGYQGYQGPHGSQGFQSVRGYQGTDGIHGVLGQMGPSGIHGNMGRQGYMGTNGVQGIEGAIGVQGPQGKHGNQGLPGSFSEVHISNILTWDEHKSFLQTQRMIRPVTILYGKSKPMNLEDNTRYISEKVMFEHPFQVIPNVMMTLEVQNGDDQIVRSHSISEITTSFFNYIVASDDPFENHQLTIHYQAVGILTVS